MWGLHSSAGGCSEGGLWSPWQGLTTNKTQDWTLDRCGPKENPIPGRDPNMSKDVETTQLEVKGMLECKGLTKWEQEGVGGVELFHRFGLGSGVPGTVGLTLPCLRNKV